MGKLARIFGFKTNLAPWYRDLALGTVCGIALIYALVPLMEPSPSAWDTKFGLGSLGIAVLSILISPNRRWILMLGLSVIVAWGGIGVLLHRPFDQASLETLAAVFVSCVFLLLLVRQSYSKKNFRHPAYFKDSMSKDEPGK